MFEKNKDWVRNIEVAKRTGIGDINVKIKRRKWKYLGHVLRMEDGSIVKRSVKWVPPGKRRRRSPKRT
jgi:hypothetical protein